MTRPALHRFPIALAVGITLAIGVQPSFALDQDNHDLWSTPRETHGYTLMDLVPGRPSTVPGTEREIDGAQGPTMIVPAPQPNAAAASADVASDDRAPRQVLVDDRFGAGLAGDTPRRALIPRMRNGVVALERPEQLRGQGSYRHHRFAHSERPQIESRPGQGQQGSYGTPRATSDAGNEVWDDAAVESDPYARPNARYGYSYGHDYGRSAAGGGYGGRAGSRSYDWQGADEQWDADDGE